MNRVNSKLRVEDKMKKTKQNQTETAITELIAQVQKVFRTAPLRFLDIHGGNSDLGNEERASGTLWSGSSLSQNANQEPNLGRDKQNSDGPENSMRL